MKGRAGSRPQYSPHRQVGSGAGRHTHVPSCTPEGVPPPAEGPSSSQVAGTALGTCYSGWAAAGRAQGHCTKRAGRVVLGGEQPPTGSAERALGTFLGLKLIISVRPSAWTSSSSQKG